MHVGRSYSERRLVCFADRVYLKCSASRKTSNDWLSAEEFLTLFLGFSLGLLWPP